MMPLYSITCEKPMLIVYKIEAENDSEAQEEAMYLLQGISEIDNPIIQNVEVSDITEDDE